MERSRKGVFPPFLGGAVTGLLAWAMARIPVGPEAGDSFVVWAVPLLLIFPFVVSALWGWALLAGRPRKLVLVICGGLIVFFLARFPQEVAWQAATNMVAGLAGGLALGTRWRLDAGLAAVTICLAPLLVWSVLQMPVRENLDLIQVTTLENMEETLWVNLEEPELSRARQRETDRLEQAIDLLERIFPSLLFVGTLGQAGLILLLAAWLARLSGGAPGLRGGGPFSEWRLPFYLVWSLVVGVALIVTRAPSLTSAGINLALVTAMLIAVQGLSVQAFFVARMLPGPMQVVFWLIMGMPLVGVLLVSSLILGLADQWIDMRRRFLARGIE